MIFNNHSNIRGRHAFLSPSNNHWLNYSDEKLEDRYVNSLAAAHGTRLHAFASEAILLKHRMARNNMTLNRYINDAISFDMVPEQILFYSENAFGTADAIRFREEDRTLRIHDLKTGVTPANFVQLEVYSALFCLEYHMKPKSLNFILRIYQNDEVLESEPELDKILWIMDRIVESDKILKSIRSEIID